MQHFRPIVLLACIAILCTSSGCLFVRHSTRTVRANERQRLVQFESEETRNIFEGQVGEAKVVKASANPQIVAVPFLLWYSRTDNLSDAAAYNDQVRACDTNGDSFITLHEARAYQTQIQAMVAASRPKPDPNAPVSTAQASSPYGSPYAAPATPQNVAR